MTTVHSKAFSQSSESSTDPVELAVSGLDVGKSSHLPTLPVVGSFVRTRSTVVVLTFCALVLGFIILRCFSRMSGKRRSQLSRRLSHGEGGYVNGGDASNGSDDNTCRGEGGENNENGPEESENMPLLGSATARQSATIEMPNGYGEGPLLGVGSERSLCVVYFFYILIIIILERIFRLPIV